MKKRLLKHLRELSDFDIDIPIDQPIFTLGAICKLLDLEYHRMHEILKEGLIKPKMVGKRKKMFSRDDIRHIKYIQYLVEDEGVNLKGVRIILEMVEEE